MKKGKVAGCSGVCADMIKILEESGVDIMVDIIGTVWEEEEMPEDWKQSEIVPIYKQKGDPFDLRNYRGIKLLEHGMKILEKIIEGRLMKTVEIDPMQFGFMPGRGTIDAIFTFQQIQEKHQEKRVELFTTFVDLKKAYDRERRDLVYWSLRKRKVPEKRTAHDKTGQFEIEVGLHQGSGLSPFLFTIVLDTISEECRNGLSWELLFADDLAIIADSEVDLQRRWLKWQIGMESKGLKVSTRKTEVMVNGRNGTKVNIKDKEGKELNQMDEFK